MRERRAAGALTASAIAVTLLAGCTEEAIVGVDPNVPGSTTPTVEIRALASELLDWQDTTYLGYELPATSPIKTLADRPDLTSRLLGRYFVPDSVQTGDGAAEIDEFIEGQFFVTIDTVQSTYRFPYKLEVFSLTQSYDSLEATWSQAAEGEPWTTPGGSLGELLGAAEFAERTETAIVDFLVPVDPVMQGWRATGGEPGVAVVTTGLGSELLVTNLQLRTTLTRVGQTDTIIRFIPAIAPTFIYDPPQPSPGLGLRLAGLPSGRAYIQFALPRVLDGVPLSGSSINHAEIIFRPLAPADQPFELERPVVASVLEVAADPFEVGAKVPVGLPILDPLSGGAQFLSLIPENLADGQPLRVSVTQLISRAVFIDSLTNLRMVLRPSPSDAQAFGYWDFGSVESPPALQPELIMLVTPPAGFPVP
jgi:hypothetical protein